MEAVALYFVGFSSLFVSAYAYMSYLAAQEVFGYSDLKFSTAAALVGACAVFAALSIVTDAILMAAIGRMGGDRPKPITKLEAGGWDVDHQRGFDIYLILGEVENRRNASASSPSPDEKMCGCCASTLEMIAGPGAARRGFFPGGDQGNSDDDEGRALMDEHRV